MLCTHIYNIFLLFYDDNNVIVDILNAFAGDGDMVMVVDALEKKVNVH